ncbi:hypothetical protein [Azospira inquinata]|uniref:EF-hand domain-containing protein n=1 Tax=Azospira inquinata TaxID=2785627 RepID=A0A975SN68_9RHOO|nr:hypothetical protein [Azospira inquinata]QWT45236.1 hypothetical protein J8L76_09785 [Azospira inquinata]QWT49432.1 hypothetical protein Azoinq_02095 [Azospira inquinata]
MLEKLQQQYAQLLTSGVQVVLVIFGFKLNSSLGWTVILALVAGLSLLAWSSTLSRRRAIADTPTAKVASAAQGYGELEGRGRALEGQPLLAPRSLLPCLWYRYQVEEKDSDNNWKVVDQGRSDACLILEDETGQCLVDPAGAEILTQHKDTWTLGDQRTTEWLLQIGDPLYALGQFRTLTGGDSLLDPAEDVKLLLAEWKKQPETLLRRFDLDGNGELSMEEWALARQAARREVAKERQAVQAQPDVHILEKPRDGRPYLLSNYSQSALARRYGLWALYHLSVFFLSLGAIPWARHFYLAG